MKISIITFWQTLDNYGQILQSYALQRVLKEKGHSPEIIRYGFHEFLYPSIHFKDIFGKSGLKNIYNHFNLFIRQFLKNEDVRKFRVFQKKYFHFSRETYNTLKDLQLNAPYADCYIAGSDQIWAQILAYENNRSFFLDFGDRDIRRVAYAPSFALKEYPIELLPILTEQLSKFNAISVREPNGVNICALAGYEAKLVLDPTLLLSSGAYCKLCSCKFTITQSPYCFIYHVNVYSPNALLWDSIKQYNYLQGIANIATYANGDKSKNMHILDKAQYVYPTIEQWLLLIKNAQYVVTTSFHGIAFSILFHKPFIYCPVPESKYAANDRVYSLLERLNITDRTLYDSNVDKTARIIETSIRWDEVDQNLYKLKKDSLDFLLSSINESSF